MQGFPRNLGSLEPSTQSWRRRGAAEEMALAQWTWRPRALGANLRDAGVEPLSEGNEARRGGEMSEPLSSTGEVGELTPGDPTEGRQRSG